MVGAIYVPTSMLNHSDTLMAMNITLNPEEPYYLHYRAQN